MKIPKKNPKPRKTLKTKKPKNPNRSSMEDCRKQIIWKMINKEKESNFILPFHYELHPRMHTSESRLNSNFFL